MRILIIDDEAWARVALRRELQQIPSVEVAGEAANGLEALEQIEALTPDLLLLDVEMPGMNGFEMLAQLRQPPPVVFVTAYSEYAVQAFEASALDYLVKPVRPERLQQALSRAAHAVASHAGPSAAVFREKAQPLRKLAVRKGKRIVLLAREDALYAQVEDELVFVHTANERYLVDRTLNELEDLLTGSGFLRIHRNAVVNLEAVTEMFPWLASGTWRVKLSNGAELDVSRERAKTLKALVGL